MKKEIFVITPKDGASSVRDISLKMRVKIIELVNSSEDVMLYNDSYIPKCWTYFSRELTEKLVKGCKEGSYVELRYSVLSSFITLYLEKTNIEFKISQRIINIFWAGIKRFEQILW